MTGAGGIEAVASAELAAAIDRRGCFRGFRYGLLSIARKGAFACFLLQYLLLFDVGFLWAVAATACVLAVELRTNRFTMTSYSTREIVDLLLRRASLAARRNDAPKRLAAGFLLWLAGVAGCAADVSFWVCHAAMFAGALWLLCVLKTVDAIGNIGNWMFEYSETGDGRFHVRARRNPGDMELIRPWEDRGWAAYVLAILYAWFAIVALFAAVVDVRCLEGDEIVLVILPLCLPLYGCAAHEAARFHLVDRELDRLREDAARDPEGWAGAVRRASGEESRIAGLGHRTSAAIAAAVERGYRWNLWLRVLGAARRYAFTWLAGPYLLAVGAHPAATILTTLCVWFVERYTNRVTMTVHSTARIVDHWMGRPALGRTAFRWGDTQTALCLAGVVGLMVCRSGAPAYLCQMLFFSAMVAAIYWAKTADFPRLLLHRAALARLFRPALRPWRNAFAGVCFLIGLALWMLLPLLLGGNGGAMARDHADQPWVLAIAVFPLLGCAGHETLRFLLVRREMARLGEAEGGAG